MDLLKRLRRANANNLIESVLIYILDRGELSSKDTFIEMVKTKLTPEVGEKIMTVAEQLKAEGIQQGVKQGSEQAKNEIAERLLSEKAEVAFIAKITGLSLVKIEELKKKH